MGLLDIFRGKLLDPTAYPGVHARGDVITTTVDAVVKWGRKSSIWPMPFGTACCAIEFMALTASHYDLARFGAEVLRFSPRQADLMFVAGTIVDKEGPVLKTIYDQMPDPKWVISMGVCASSGGFYRSYHVMQGIDEIIPVDVYVPGCPPSPEALIAAVMKIQDRIARGEQARRPQGEHRVGASGEGYVDRRQRKAAWAHDDAARAESGLPPRGVVAFAPAPSAPAHGHGQAPDAPAELGTGEHPPLSESERVG
jgi:NADH-quinone oxidoreductase subunit B